MLEHIGDLVMLRSRPRPSTDACFGTASTQPLAPRGHRTWAAARWPVLGLALVLASCSTKRPPVPPPPPAPTPQRPAPPPVQAPVPAPKPQVPEAPTPSRATDAKAYRQDAARHLYDKYREQIYVGKLPPLLYAVGVLNVRIDARGQVTGIDWTRAPSHAPEVMARIESMVRAAAPYPAPARMGKVTYTDVWLWDKSGRWQLDTLTEGQL